MRYVDSKTVLKEFESMILCFRGINREIRVAISYVLNVFTTIFTRKIVGICRKINSRNLILRKHNINTQRIYKVRYKKNLLISRKQRAMKI